MAPPPIALHITPRPTTPRVLDFCASVNPGGRPRIVRCFPRLPGQPNECFANVAAHVARWGGEAVHGWAIWEIRDLMIEAEFHAVWRDRAGSLFDVNPRPRTYPEILFLPQPELTSDGRQRNNIRRALRDDPAVHAFIDQAERRFKFLEPYDVGVVSVNREEWAAAFPNEVGIDDALFRLALAARWGKDPCICGSGRQYRKCHQTTALARLAETDAGPERE